MARCWLSLMILPSAKRSRAWVASLPVATILFKASRAPWQNWPTTLRSTIVRKSTGSSVSDKLTTNGPTQEQTDEANQSVTALRGRISRVLPTRARGPLSPTLSPSEGGEGDDEKHRA